MIWNRSLRLSHACWWCCVVIYLTILLRQKCTGQDNTGRLFFICFLENRVLLDMPQTRVYVTSLSEVKVIVSIRVPLLKDRYPDALYHLQPGEVIIHEFDYELHMIGTSRGSKGVLIESTGLISVVGASINDLSTDAFLALPMEALGYDYFIMSYMYQNVSQNTQGPSQMAVLGTQPFTDVEITLPSSDIEIIDSTLKFTDNKAKTIIEFCETVQLQSKQDLSGTRVRSSKPVAVFGGDVWVSITEDHMGDHLTEQMPPTRSWGTEFYGAPLATRSAGDIYRVLARKTYTSVRIKRFSHLTGNHSVEDVELQRAELHQFDVASDESIHILANNPVLLTQFCRSYGADNQRLSDPFMAIIPPIPQYLSAYTYHTITTLFQKENDDFLHFMNLIAPANETDDLYLDGQLISEEYFNQSWTLIPGTGFSYAILEMTAGRHEIRHRNPNITFFTLVYGLKFQESYGFTLGQQLVSLPNECIKTEMVWADLFDNDCDGRLDEEVGNGVDDDGDGLVDEDVYDGSSPRDKIPYDKEDEIIPLEQTFDPFADLYAGQGPQLLLLSTAEERTWSGDYVADDVDGARHASGPDETFTVSPGDSSTTSGSSYPSGPKYSGSKKSSGSGSGVNPDNPKEAGSEGKDSSSSSSPSSSSNSTDDSGGLTKGNNQTLSDPDDGDGTNIDDIDDIQSDPQDADFGSGFKGAVILNPKLITKGPGGFDPWFPDEGDSTEQDTSDGRTSGSGGSGRFSKGDNGDTSGSVVVTTPVNGDMSSSSEGAGSNGGDGQGGSGTGRTGSTSGTSDGAGGNGSSGEASSSGSGGDGSNGGTTSGGEGSNGGGEGASGDGANGGTNADGTSNGGLNGTDGATNGHFNGSDGTANGGGEGGTNEGLNDEGNVKNGPNEGGSSSSGQGDKDSNTSKTSNNSTGGNGKDGLEQQKGGSNSGNNSFGDGSSSNNNNMTDGYDNTNSSLFDPYGNLTGFWNASNSSLPSNGLYGQGDGTQLPITAASSTDDDDDDSNLLMIVIPLSVLIGSPICCCILCCGKSCILARFKKDKTKGKVSPDGQKVAKTKAPQNKGNMRRTSKPDNHDARIQNNPSKQRNPAKIEGIVPFSAIRSRYEMQGISPVPLDGSGYQTGSSSKAQNSWASDHDLKPKGQYVHSSQKSHSGTTPVPLKHYSSNQQSGGQPKPSSQMSHSGTPMPQKHYHSSQGHHSGSHTDTSSGLSSPSTSNSMHSLMVHQPKSRKVSRKRDRNIVST